MTKKQPEEFAMWTYQALFELPKSSLCGHLSINLPSNKEFSEDIDEDDQHLENDALDARTNFSNFENPTKTHWVLGGSPTETVGENLILADSASCSAKTSAHSLTTH
jgi:hypothetical protein